MACRELWGPVEEHVRAVVHLEGGRHSREGQELVNNPYFCSRAPNSCALRALSVHHSRILRRLKAESHCRGVANLQLPSLTRIPTFAPQTLHYRESLYGGTDNSEDSGLPAALASRSPQAALPTSPLHSGR